MRDDDSITRLHVGQLLDEMDFQNAREVLMAAVASPDPELSMLGIRAIGLSGSADDVDLLVQAGRPDRRSDRSRRGRVGVGQNWQPWLRSRR